MTDFIQKDDFFKQKIALNRKVKFSHPSQT